jgi:uncharacterized membrane protein
MTYDVQPLRPLTIGELLDRTFSFYRQHFVLFVGIAALPNLFGLAFGLPRVFVDPRTSGYGATILWLIANLAVALIASTLSQGATVIAVSQIQLGRETNVREAFATIRAQLGELIIIGLNVALRVGLGFLLFIVPGVLLALKYAVAIPVAILEQNGVSASLSRSGDLTQGDRGRIFLIYLLLFILLFAAGLVWQIPAGIVARIIAGGATPQLPVSAQIVLQFGTFVSRSILAPIMTIAFTLVYYDERVRKEAFDLEHMIQQLDRTNAGAPPTV